MRNFLAIDRVTALMGLAGYRKRPEPSLEAITGWADVVLYFTRESDEPGPRGHKPVWECHFSRDSVHKPWKLDIAFKRMSTGDGNDDVTVRSIPKLREAVNT